VVIEDGTTMVAVSSSFLSTGVEEAAGLMADILVSRDTITWFEIVLTDSHFLFRLIHSQGRTGTTSMLTCELTGSAFGWLAGTRTVLVSRYGRRLSRLANVLFPLAHEILQPAKTSMAKTLMPK